MSLSTTARRPRENRVSPASYHIWTIGDRATASTRLRIHQYLPLLAADGIRTRVRTIPKGFVQRLLLKGSLGRRPNLLLQKKLFSPGAVRRLRARVDRLLFDVDDAIHLDGPGSSRNADRFRAVTAVADRVTAGNAALAEACADRSRSRVVPTPVDTRRVRPGRRASRDPGLVVWIGSRTNLANLPPVLDAFRGVAPRHPAARLVVLADRAPEGLGGAIEFHPWSLEAETELLRRAAVGLMPLEDTPFNRGKCGFKILLYQAAGLAVLASPVGVNRELIEPGRTGYLPDAPTAWADGLDRLLGDPTLARRLGDAGRAAVERTHAVEVLYPRFRDALLGAS